MKFVFEVKHNKANTNKANEIIADLKKMARDRGFDMQNEIDIKINRCEDEQIKVYPTIYFDKGEYYPDNAQKFTADYLNLRIEDKGVLISCGDLINLE